ncbi:MAG: radical SAM protein [Elusimicrobia bacterium]|nr:radical SAM protein [Elusimicrobiota bacterium]
MNVTCVYLRADKSVLRSELLPLGVGYIVSSLKSVGCNTEVLFINLQSDIYKTLSTANKPDVVAISVASREDLLFLGKVMPSIKKLFPKARIIAGGAYVTYSPQEFAVESLMLDALCIGEGDTAIKKYVAMVRNENFEKTDNLWLKQTDGGWLKCTRSVFEENIDALPYPDRAAFDKLLISTDTNTLILNRGCPNECIYCTSTVFKKASEGKYVRQRKAESIIAEIEDIQKNYQGTSGIILNSDNALSDPQNFFDLLKALKDYNAHAARKIDFTLRFNFLPKLLTENADIVNMMKAAGIHYVMFGLESGCPEVRKRLKRPYYENAQVIKFARELREHKIMTEVYAMYCYPFETRQSYKQTIECLKQIKADTVRYSLMVAPKGTELCEYFENNSVKKLSVVEYFRVRTVLFRVYISYKPFWEVLKKVILGDESGGLGTKSFFVSWLSKMAIKKRALNTK